MEKDQEVLRDKRGRSGIPERNSDLARTLGLAPYRDMDLVRIERTQDGKGWLITSAPPPGAP